MATPYRTKDCPQHFELKTVGKDTFIQGWANKAVVDRGKDVIHQAAWDTENFKKVPTILFNHDKDKPIGKAVDIRPTDQGLWIKAKLSNSKDPMISMVRDLVQEGMLNAFSVGFDAKDEQKNADGINEIKNAELYEVSVVTLPMNQDSTFDLSAKSLGTLSKAEASQRILKAKGACVAEAVHDKIYEMEKAGGIRGDILSKISSAAGISPSDLTQILAGNVIPVPEKVLGAFSQALEMNMEQLKKLDQGDAAVDKKPEPTAPKKEDVKPQNKPVDEPKPAKKDSEQDQVGVVGILVPKEQAQDAEAAKALVTEAGYEPMDVQEQDSAWYVLLTDPADFQDSTGTLDLGNGVTAVVGVRKPIGDQPPETGEPQDTQQPAQTNPSIKPPAQGKDSAATPPPKADGNPDQAKQDYEAYKRDENATTSGEPGNPASWVADEALWEKAKKASEDALGKIDYGFVVWWYLQNGGTKKSILDHRTKDSATTPIGQDMPVDDNPYLAQARQTNILLGVLIKEFQTLCAAMQGNAIEAPPAQDQPPADQQQGKEAELEKQVVINLEKFVVKLEEQVKKLGA